MSTHPGFDGATAGPASARDAVLRLLRKGGLSTGEAGNLIAYAAGIHPHGEAWSLREIQGLLFVGWLVDTGRLKS
jgi:hypothetical protein